MTALTWYDPRIARVLYVAGVLIVACSTATTAPLARVANGDWSDASARMTVTDTGATIFMTCEVDTIPIELTLDAGGNFERAGRATVGINVAGRPSHPAVFTGHATVDAVSITRSVTDGTGILPVTHVLARGSVPFSPCP